MLIKKNMAKFILAPHSKIIWGLPHKSSVNPEKIYVSGVGPHWIEEKSEGKEKKFIEYRRDTVSASLGNRALF